MDVTFETKFGSKAGKHEWYTPKKIIDSMNCATALFFIKGRISFIDSESDKTSPAGAPSVLIAYGNEAKEILRGCTMGGKFVELL